jgi:hypothetical protein
MIDIDVNVRKIEDSEECTGEGCTCVACNDKDCDRAIDLNKEVKWNVNVLYYNHILMEFHKKKHNVVIVVIVKKKL